MPSGCCLCGSVTDRRDFYTQAGVSLERSLTNACGPAVPLALLKDTSAAKALLDRGRHDIVDPGLYTGYVDFRRPPLLVSEKQVVHPTFKALFQGDAGGVEYATSAHEGLLQAWGCLLGPGRLESRSRVAGVGPWQGLIIDDFFSLSVEGSGFTPGAPSLSSAFIDRSKEGYAAEKVLGSDNKEIRSQRLLCVAGAQIDSTEAVPTVLIVPWSSLLPRLSTWAFLCKQGPFTTARIPGPRPGKGGGHGLLLLAACCDAQEAVLSCAPSASDRGPGLPKVSCETVLTQALLEVARKGEGAVDPSAHREPGLESVIVNDILSAAPWKTEAAWRWRAGAHINVLEAQAAVRAVRHIVSRGGDRKTLLLLDSSVARGAIAKGRSSSRLLRPILLRMCATLAGGGVYLGLAHAPTRLNVADDPSRSVPLRQPQGVCLSLRIGPGEFRSAALGLCCLSRPTAGWVRLSLLLSLRVSRSRLFGLLEALRQPFRAAWQPVVGEKCFREGPQSTTALCYDQTLGYPGEGPLRPRNTQDSARKASRTGRPLLEGRPVLQQTSRNRAALLTAFLEWLQAAGFGAGSLEEWPAEEISEVQGLVGNFSRLAIPTGTWLRR